MMNTRMLFLSRKLTTIGAVVTLLLTAPANGAALDLSWYTIDGGGAMRCTGGDLELSGTIGQFDAGLVTLTGGNLELTGGFWAGVVEPITIVAAESCLLHDEGGPNETELCIDLFETNGVEPRVGGPQTLAFEAGEDMDAPTIIPANVQIDCANQVPGTISVMLDGMRTIVVDCDTPLADEDCCTFTFDGMQSLGGAPLIDSAEVVALKGDLDFNGGVTGGDASIIKPHFGEIVGVDLTAPQWDYDRNGGVTGGDFALIKPLFGNIAPACP